MLWSLGRAPCPTRSRGSGRTTTGVSASRLVEASGEQGALVLARDDDDRCALDEAPVCRPATSVPRLPLLGLGDVVQAEGERGGAGQVLDEVGGLGRAPSRGGGRSRGSSRCRDRPARAAGRRATVDGVGGADAHEAAHRDPGADAASRRAWMTTPWRSGPTTAYALIGGRARRRADLCQLGQQGELRAVPAHDVVDDVRSARAARPAGSRRPRRRAPARPRRSQSSRAAPASSPRRVEHLGLDRGVHRVEEAATGIDCRRRQAQHLLHPSGEPDEHRVGGVVDGAHGARPGLEHEVADGHGTRRPLPPAQLADRPLRDGCAPPARPGGEVRRRRRAAPCGRRGRARAAGHPHRRAWCTICHGCSPE